MADRINVTTGTVAGGQAPVGPRAARFIAAGQCQFGPTDAPRIVRSLQDFRNTYGDRSGGANLYDAAETFFKAGGSELVVQRASGPSAVNATVSLSAGAIVVTSRWPGAYYNAWTAAYTSASKTLTLVKAFPTGSRTVTYSGADAAALQAAASVDPDVTVTVSSLPGSNVAATNLATGTDDFANVSWATVLGKVDTSWGPGCVAVPGVNGAAAALAAHAAATGRLALLTPQQSDSASTVASAQAAITAANQSFATYAYPWGRVPDGAGGKKVTDATGYLAGLNSVALTAFGMSASPLRRAVHALGAGAEFEPLVAIDAAAWAALEPVGVAIVETLATGVGANGWGLASGVGGNANLKPAKYRVCTNAIVDDVRRACDQYVDRNGTPLLYAEIEAALDGMLERYVAADAIVAKRVKAGPGADPADNRISVTVSVLFPEAAMWIDAVVNVGAANQTL